jgi:hypothetical protein
MAGNRGLRQKRQREGLGSGQTDFFMSGWNMRVSALGYQTLLFYPFGA